MDLPSTRPGEAATRHVNYLEPAQLEEYARRPVEPAALTGHIRAGLWALRVFVLIVTAMIIYAFVTQF